MASEDRVKELIKYKVRLICSVMLKVSTLTFTQGFQVAPAELEGLLLDNPQVNDAAVIGLQDAEQQTELPRAYIVLAQGVEKTDATKQQIADWLHQKVANHKKLRGGIYFIDEVPKSVSGKILRRVLKEQALEEQAGPKAKL